MPRSRIDGRYFLGDLLGSGGMARVYLAHDEVLDRDVALKILREQYAEDEEFVGRFRREARSAARLSHPNIVAVHDWGRSKEGIYYIAMEYVSGGTLKERVAREGALDPGVAAGVALLISDALLAAHENGVIHRDIKSQNVLVTRTGSVKVTDFGIARAASAHVTATSVVLGTAAYMSPEQAMGEPVGPRSDLYSLGVVLFEMLTGELPYKAKSPIAQAMKHVNEPPRSPREANPDVPEELDALTAKLLAKSAEDRYPSAVELANDLERVRSGLPPLAAGARKAERIAGPLPPLPPVRERWTQRMAIRLPVVAPVGAPGRGRRRKRRLFSTLVMLLFVGVLGVFALTQYFSPSGPEGSGDNPGAEKAVQVVPSPSTPPAPGKQKAAGKKK